MYNDLEIIKKEKKKLLLCVIISSLIYLIYFYYYIIMGSFIDIAYSIFVMLIIFFTIYSATKIKEDKLKPNYMSDDEFESSISTEFPIATLIPSIACLFYVSVGVITTIIEKGFQLASIELAVYILVTLSLIFLAGYYFRRYFNLSTLLYKNGIRNYSGDILFKDIKKYNFLKLKKAGYSFEVNLGGEYHRFKVSADQRERILDLLKQAK